MTLDGLFADLSVADGFMASSLFTDEGEVLASCCVEPAIDMTFTGEALNDVFHAYKSAPWQSTVRPCSELVIVSPHETAIMGCSGLRSTRHLHTLAVVRADSNRAEMEHHVRQILPRALELLT